MTGFVVFYWATPDTVAERRLADVRTNILPSWTECASGMGWLILAEPSTPVLLEMSDDGGARCVIGELFDRSATNLGTAAPGRPELTALSFPAFAGKIAKDYWGAFVAIEINLQDPAAVTAFRDPVGGLDCVAWRSNDMLVLTSCPELLLGSLPPKDFAIDWSRVSGLIYSPGAALEHLPFRGLIDVIAGAVTRITDNDHSHTVIWSPADFVRTNRPPDRGKAVELPALVDACISAWAQNSKCAVAELSGGLDSAIVAAGLQRLPMCPVAGWLHYHPPDFEGDERIYARAVADHLSLPLTEIVLSPPKLEKSLIEGIPVRLRPVLSGVSLSHQRDLATRAGSLGADTLFTGQGGDALFFQSPSPLIAGDIWRSGRKAKQRLRAIEDLARWSRRPIWAILGSALTSPMGIRRPRPLAPFVSLLSPRLEPDPCHLGWLSDQRGISPAKTLQIMGLAMARCVFGGANGPRAVHPLLSQPLIERCLAISAFDLTEGRRDRALIRRAYQNRLPALLLDRHGKGDMAAFYGRALAAAVPFLRSYLLNGALAAYSVIDGDKLSELLHPEEIMVREVSVELFSLVFMEHWARHWLAKGVFSTS